MGNFADAIKFYLDNEGVLEENPADKGGLTKYGVSLVDYQKYFPEATADTIRNLTLDQAIEFYHKDKWLPMYDEIADQNLTNKIFDMGENMGPGHAYKIVQAALDWVVRPNPPLVIDGVLGAKSIADINAAEPVSLLEEIQARQVLYYIDDAKANPSQVPFLNGWIRRAVKP